MRTIGMLALAGFAVVALLAAWVPDAMGQLAAGDSVGGAAFASAALPHNPRVALPHPVLRFVGAPGRVTGAGEAPASTTSLTTRALHALAGAKWMLTRHIGLFFDYKFRTADPPYSMWNTTADPKLPINHVFGGVAIDF